MQIRTSNGKKFFSRDCHAKMIRYFGLSSSEKNLSSQMRKIRSENRREIGKKSSQILLRVCVKAWPTFPGRISFLFVPRHRIIGTLKSFWERGIFSRKMRLKKNRGLGKKVISDFSVRVCFLTEVDRSFHRYKTPNRSFLPNSRQIMIKTHIGGAKKDRRSSKK